LHGIDTDGVINSRKVSRTKLAEAVHNLAPTTVAMEAGAGAHHWGRLFIAAECKVRLINPRFVKPFVKGSKNDATDAEAIFEAAEPANHALRSGKEHWPTGYSIAASCARTLG
jgi:transposase